MSNIPPNMIVLTKFQLGIYMGLVWISGAMAAGGTIWLVMGT